MYQKAVSIVLAALAVSATAFAVDGVHLIDQNTVITGGGFPYVISGNGSYRLASNLVAPGSTAIMITSGNVTLDLNGFSVMCGNCSNVPGIVSNGPNTTITNGTVTRFGGSTGTCIYFQTSDAPLIVNKVDGVTVSGCNTGIQSDRGDLTVINSTASKNFFGIVSLGNLTVTNSTASNNGNSGISMNTGTVSNSIIANNGGGTTGLRGGIGANSAMITGNTITNNSVFGIYQIGYPYAIAFGQNTFSGNAVTTGAGALSLNNNVCTTSGSATLC